jgi:serine/threonine-protein phosphatase 2A catalytic subunit
MDELDQWIAHLSACKQLTEPDIKRLCDKASSTSSWKLAFSV